jgi:hypothetical protein
MALEEGAGRGKGEKERKDVRCGGYRLIRPKYV